MLPVNQRWLPYNNYSLSVLKGMGFARSTSSALALPQRQDSQWTCQKYPRTTSSKHATNALALIEVFWASGLVSQPRSLNNRDACRRRVLGKWAHYPPCNNTLFSCFSHIPSEMAASSSSQATHAHSVPERNSQPPAPSFAQKKHRRDTHKSWKTSL